MTGGGGRGGYRSPWCGPRRPIIDVRLSDFVPSPICIIRKSTKQQNKLHLSFPTSSPSSSNLQPPPLPNPKHTPSKQPTFTRPHPEKLLPALLEPGHPRPVLLQRGPGPARPHPRLILADVCHELLVQPGLLGPSEVVVGGLGLLDAGEDELVLLGYLLELALAAVLVQADDMVMMGGQVMS